MTNQPVIGISGYKNAGKTTLTERLIAELTARGLSVSSVKHAHHSVDIDEPGRDTHRHREAGAYEVALATSSRFAIMHELRGAPEPQLNEILSRLAPVDLIIVEGFKSEPIPKIEVRREGAARALATDIPGIIAIASDAPPKDTHLPVFALDDISGIAAFIIGQFSLEAGNARALG
jgi:molybdopterin-guanine dinucleotide biosynthesis protein B